MRRFGFRPDNTIGESLNWSISEAVANRMRIRIGQNLVVQLDHVLTEEQCRLAGLTSMSSEILARGGGLLSGSDQFRWLRRH